jgi:hypothetical protein
MSFVPTNRISIATILNSPEAGYFGFSYCFEGCSPHYKMVVFDSVESALAYCDPHHEHIWEKPTDADEKTLPISRDFKANSVLWQTAHLTLTEPVESRKPSIQPHGTYPHPLYSAHVGWR